MLLLAIINFIDTLGFGIIFPLLPDIQNYLSLTDLEVGYISSSFAFSALFGSIVWGILSDKFGRKIIIILPIFLSAITYLFTVYANSFYMLLILRILSGFFTANFTVLFAATIDMSKPKDKIKNLGIVSAGLGLGFILGPSLGGILIAYAKYLHMFPLSLPFYGASCLSLSAGICALFFFKESLSLEERKLKNKVSIFLDIKQLYTQRSTLLLTYLSVILYLIFAGLEVYLTLWLSQYLHFTSIQIGIYWGIFAIIVTITELTLIRFLSNRQALAGGFLLFTISQLVLIVTYNIYSLCLMTLLFAISFGVIMPAINVNISNQGNKNQQGMLFGINQSVGNFGRLIGPYLIGILYQIHNSWAWICATILAVISTLIAFIFL